MVAIFRIARQLVDLNIQRHGHLDGVNPCPPAIQRTIGLLRIGRHHLVIQIGNDVLQFLAPVGLDDRHQFDIRLRAALVISIAGVYAVAWCPLVEVCPP